MDKQTIYKIYGKDYKEMTKHLLLLLSLKDDIPEGARIGIKPNLVSPTPAMFGATTHPEVAAGIIEYLQENGFSDITVIEGSWVGDKTSESFEYCGYRSICEKYGVLFIDTQKDSYSKVDCDGMEINISDEALKLDYIINVPVLKGHGQTKITCALKNMKGLIPNSEKRLFHRLGLHRPIAHLQKGIHQDFVVVDHICGDLELEDGGNPVQTDCIMAGKDPVLIDTYAAHILGYQTSDIPYIEMSEELGIGSTSLEECKLLVCDASGNIVQYDALSGDPREVNRQPSDKLLNIMQNVEDVESCSSCYGALIPALKRLEEEGLLDAVMSKLNTKICIGQGCKEKEGRFGVGNCTRSFDEHIPGCPPTEEDIYNYLRSLL